MTYTTVELVSASLKGLSITADTTPSSSQVSEWISEASSQIDVIFGKTFSSTTITDEYIDYDGSGYLRLPYAPIISISSLTHLKGSLSQTATSTSLTEGRGNDFIIYKESGEIEFFGNRAPTYGKQNIKWSGVIGFNSVPKWVQRLATLMVSKRVVEATVSSVSQKGGRPISVGNLSLGAPSNFSSSQIKNMNDEIESLISGNINGSHVFRTKRIYRK